MEKRSVARFNFSKSDIRMDISQESEIGYAIFKGLNMSKGYANVINNIQLALKKKQIGKGDSGKNLGYNDEFMEYLIRIQRWYKARFKKKRYEIYLRKEMREKEKRNDVNYVEDSFEGY